MGRLIVLIFLATACASEMDPETQALRAADPLIGTGGHGHTFPGVTRPFGMVQLSPDTRLEGWDGCSGYHDDDRVIYGFSHTHLSGTGISDYGDVLLMPTVGPVQLHNGYPDDPDGGYASRFRKKTEHTIPAFYFVKLDDYDVDVTLTTTDRAGMHDYRFPATDEANVIVDLAHRDEVLDAFLRVVDDSEIEGHRISRSWAREQHVYFVAKFSHAFERFGVAVDDSILAGATEASGHNVKAHVGWSFDRTTSVIVKVGISAVSIEGARRNLEREMPGWVFHEVWRGSVAAWKSALGKILIEDPSKERKRIFYTALYHSMIAPNLYSDVDGQYRGTDLRTHAAAAHRIYTVFSLWDTFRAAHPLYALIERERTSEFIGTFLTQYLEGGQLPVWELAANYTGTMIGYHAVPVILDARAKGIRDFDTRIALNAMIDIAERDDLGKPAYREHGYIPSTEEAESVSRTLEYAYDDWCIAQFALATGNTDTYRIYIERAQSWMNVFDPGTGFMRARQNGGWFGPFDPAEVNFHYTEANAWQYTFFVPHDIGGLIDAVGGPEAFEAQLDALFDASAELSGRDQPDITGLIGQYAHGNEPSHHMAYLYNYVGKPWKTQQRVRQIMDEMYSDAPDGLSGNEDCGQMSAWYVLSALGFYPVTPGRTDYAIGTPRFERATIALENGNVFTVVAELLSDRNLYIQSATLNGAPLEVAFIEHDAIMAGGELHFVLGPEPNTAWGASVPDIPAIPAQDRIAPVPFITAAAKTFTDSLRVEMGSACDGCEIHYTANGGVPSAISLAYDGPLTLTRTQTLRAIAVAPSGRVSRPATAEFFRIEGGRSITLHTEYANQYSGGGDMALIDYQRGNRNWRTGGWQGYWGKDLDALIDLGNVRPIRRISTGFLQDIRSWIWFPVEVSYEVSTDGEKWEKVASVASRFPDNREGTFVEAFSADVSTRARYLRVRATNYGVCPDWHPGAGGDAWIFVDEVTVE